jgi:hypothetical protein
MAGEPASSGAKFKHHRFRVHMRQAVPFKCPLKRIVIPSHVSQVIGINSYRLGIFDLPKVNVPRLFSLHTPYLSPQRSDYLVSDLGELGSYPHNLFG